MKRIKYYFRIYLFIGWEDWKGKDSVGKKDEHREDPGRGREGKTRPLRSSLPIFPSLSLPVSSLPVRSPLLSKPSHQKIGCDGLDRGGESEDEDQERRQLTKRSGRERDGIGQGRSGYLLLSSSSVLRPPHAFFFEEFQNS